MKNGNPSVPQPGLFWTMSFRWLQVKAAEKTGGSPTGRYQKGREDQKKSQMGLMSGRNNSGRKEEEKAMVKVKNGSGRCAGPWAEGAQARTTQDVGATIWEAEREERSQETGGSEDPDGKWSGGRLSSKAASL